jgi:ankyrin repeat protein
MDRIALIQSTRSPEHCLHLINEAGVDVYIKARDGRNALHFACCEGHLQIVQSLITYNSNDTEICGIGRAQHEAIRYGHLNIVQYFAEFTCAVVNPTGMNSFRVACLYGHLAIVKFLLPYFKEDEIVQNARKRGKTALHFAILRDHAEIVKFLFAEGGFDANEARASDGMTYLQYACMHGKLKVVQHLIKEFKVNVETSKMDSWTALHLASSNNQLYIVHYLVEEGRANDDAVTKNG